ncbi:histidine kinase [Aureimonas endophytica]|uniref:histidine kinase n=1 Tax=Aureimonas endophytica TaxID=2027858 RepID=A0A916ZZ73_9HYPH|nr:sensor histidine kinase [Aureimonas endophytica]GGE18625.1 histidine kinase [Aureimonas endophytica]
MPVLHQMERRFGRFVLLAVVLGFAALVVAVAAAAWGFARTQEMNGLLVHTYRVELTLAEIRTLTERAETSRRGFLIEPNERFFQTFVDTEAQIAPVLGTIDRLVADNPSQVERAQRLRSDVERQRLTIASSFETRRGGDAATARQAFLSEGGGDIIRDLRRIADEMVAEEQGLLDARRQAQERSLAHTYWILAAAGLILVVVGGGTVELVRRNLAALRASRNDLRALNDNLEAAVETRTADLQRANDEIQRFAYIVSHDLRSPLVNVMGFTSELDAALKPLSDLVERAEAEAPQLASEEAKLAVREDLPEAIGFIRSSTQKMDRLINAILRLSREGRRVIQPERIDAAEVLEGIAASLAHRSGEIGAEIAIEKPLPGLVSDRLAVEQIFSNLIENALKYRDQARPARIAIRGRREGKRVVFDVADNGRGIDPRDHERIFDLFRRSGPQDQPGEGIGLAHVRALAYRLGGNISCSSELGRGSTFSLALPAIYSPRKEG